MRYKHTILGRCCALAVGLAIAASVPVLYGSEAFAETVTVRIKYGKTENCGDHDTIWKWVTHVNGEPIDLSDEPGVSRCYAYCVEPMKKGPGEGTYTVAVVDDEDTGKIADMRKMIYYLPGAYGYTSVTKERWFSAKSSYSDYALGHLALSYMYDNCKSGTDALKGVSTAGKNKVKKMVGDLAELEDPPEEFEVFWVKEKGLQSYFGAIYATEFGRASVRKISLNPVISEGNRCYTTEGAEYTIYKDESCNEPAETKDGGTAVLRTGTDGQSDEIVLQTGDYFIRETAAPRGYALNGEIQPLHIVRGELCEYEAGDMPKCNPVEIIIQKIDAETGLSKAQGKASLGGAEYTIKYYDVTPDDSMTEAEALEAVGEEEPAMINGSPAVWVFRTDSAGRIDFSKPDTYMTKEESSDQYTDSEGRFALPIGIVTIQETKAPKGYMLDSTIYVRTVDERGTVEKLESFTGLIGKDAHREQYIHIPEKPEKGSKKVEPPEDSPQVFDAPETGDTETDVILYLLLGILALIEAGLLTVIRLGGRLNKGSDAYCGRHYMRE